MLGAIHDSLVMLFDPLRISFMILGICAGIIVGLLPGLGGTVGMSLLLPFIYGMDPYTGMALLIGMIAVLHTADTYTSVLLGVPGSAGSQATIMDGHPLAQQGQASRALGAAFFCSMIGGIIGGFILLSVIPVVRPIVLAFGSPELLMLSLLGLSMVGILAGSNPIRGLTAAFMGLMLGAIGSAPTTGEYRYTFNSLYLSDGIPLAVLALGLFAFPVMIDLLVDNRSISETEVAGSRLDGIKDAIKHKWLVLRSSVLGSIVGIIPGLGGSVVDWISYGIAKQTTRKNNRFGQGDIRGVIAPESANNAKEGGTLIPTLLFGIPGGGTTAMLLGGLLLLGVQPGPNLVTTQLSLTLTVVWTLVLANIIGVIFCFLLTKPVARLCFTPAKLLVPFLLIVLLLGAYQTTRSWGDLIAFFVIGIVGFIMKELNWPRAPLLIGFVLAVSVERYLWISVSRYGFSWLKEPSVILIGLLIVCVLGFNLFFKRPLKMSSGESHHA